MKRDNKIGKTTHDEDYLHRWFTKMASNRANVVLLRRDDEEMYFADVENTRSQFTKDQLSKIEKKYDIPISTKVVYAILEQVLSFLSGSKPYPKLIAPSEDPQAKQFTMLYEQAHNACWYESKANDELTICLRDMINVGSGFMHVRKNNFFSETTFNVVQEVVPWTDVLVDPASRKSDFSDAEMMCIVKVLPKTKAEREYDVTLADEDYISASSGSMGAGYGDTARDPYLFPASVSTGGYGDFRNDKYVWVRTFYEKKLISVYISDNGDLATKKPKPITVPNEDKAKLGQQLEQMLPQLQAAMEAQQTSMDASQQAEEQVQTSTDPSQALGQQESLNEANEQVAAQGQALAQQYAQMKQAFEEMDDMVPAFEMETLGGTTKVVYELEKIKRKQIERTLMVGTHVMEKEVLPCQDMPLVHFCFSHNRSPNKTYGLVHYIKDVQKAMNKYWAALIYDMQINSNRKILAPKGAIENIAQWENDYSQPGAVLEWEYNENLKDNGKPEIMDASPVNQGMVQIITMLTSLAEYITGIFGVMQGNQQGAPDTASGMNSLQNFGTQRVKLYGRYIENSLQQLALVTIQFMQAYSPKGKILQYFDDQNNPQELEMLEGGEDLKFKVRVNIANNLPTARQMAAQLIATISGQTSNPHVADLLTQYALKIMDIPEADKMLQDMDVVKNLEAQLGQMQQQLEEQTNRNKALENQNIQQSMSNHIELAKQDVSHEADMLKAESGTSESEQLTDLF